MARQLGLPVPLPWSGSSSRKRWAYWHGPYTATQVQPLRGLKGVHLDGNYRRFDPARGLARAVVGGLVPETGRGASGMELALDSVLTGVPGEAVLLKDRSGRRYDSPSRRVREPVAGHDVYLTIDAELQEIAERALAEAIVTAARRTPETWCFSIPRTGELLAHRLAARGAGTAAPIHAHRSVRARVHRQAVHRRGAASGRARWTPTTRSAARAATGACPPARGRRPAGSPTPTREHGTLTLAQAIEVSSNIAMAKFAQRLAPSEQYDVLRDFGFGSPTGVEFPSESRGRLARPDRWQPMYTRASMAMGYEFGVTPVQLAAAYGAIANDGVLLTPTLLREVRRADGALVVSPAAGAGTAGGKPGDRGAAPRVSRRRGRRGRHR